MVLEAKRISIEKNEQEEVFTLETIPLKYREEIVPFNYNYVPVQSSAEMVFAGYGIEEEIYSDYTNLDVKGKIVVVFDGQPQKFGEYILTDNKRPSRKYSGYAEKMKIAKQKGAVGLVFIMDEADYAPYYRNRPQRFYAKWQTDSLATTCFNTFIISNECAQNTFGFEKKRVYNVEKRRYERKLVSTSTFGQISNYELDFKIPQVVKTYEGVNILGLIKGDSLPDEVVIISAHYDHIGYGARTGKLRPGADDNASGVAALLEVAQAFKEASNQGYKPKRTILFAAWAVEELGLLGSNYYASNQPLIDLDNTIAVINADMIGRTGFGHQSKEEYVYVIGSDMINKSLDSLITSVNRENLNIKLDYKFKKPANSQSYFYRSDQYSFHQKGIPSVLFFGGEHADYHSPRDTPDKLNYNLLTKRARLIFLVTQALSENGI